MWWEQLSRFQQIMFIIATSSSGVMLIFLVLMAIGIDNSEFDGIDEIDIDVINDEPLIGFAGLRILTLRGILVLLSMGAWTAFLVEPYMHVLLALGLGLVVGLISAYLVALAFRASLKLESTGNIDYKHAVSKYATVYIRVLKNRSGKGKVTLNLQERFIEVDAITDEDEDLLNQSKVEVIDIYDETTLIVQKKSK